MIFDDDMAEMENKRLLREAADEREYQELHDEWCLLLMDIPPQPPQVGETE